MERVYAFTDEYGAFGWDVDNPTVSTYFIITAIIVKESDLKAFEDGAEAVRKKHFQTGEIKSSRVGKQHERRVRILNDLMSLPFSFFSVCIDKKKCLENMNSKGLQYKRVFYKFMNNIVHKELRRAFEKITVVADEIGGNEYMQSFCKYVANHQDIPNLWGDAAFSFHNSKDDVRIQVADLISGTLAYVFDNHKKTASAPDFWKILQPRMNRVELYPKTYENYHIEDSAIALPQDESIYDLELLLHCAILANYQSNSLNPCIRSYQVNQSHWRFPASPNHGIFSAVIA